MEINTPIANSYVKVNHPGYFPEPAAAVRHILASLLEIVPSARNDYGAK